MNCDSKKICGWIQSLAQLTVAAVILWVGYNVQIHLARMVDSWERTSEAVVQMQQDVQRIEARMGAVDHRMQALNHSMLGVQRRMSPWSILPW